MEDGTENIFTCDACRYTFAANKNTEQCPDCGKFAVRGASAEEIENYRKIQIEIAHTLGSDPNVVNQVPFFSFPESAQYGSVYPRSR